MDKIKIECIMCKKEHFVSKSNKNTKCCSLGCANRYRASKIKRPNCKFCGNSVYRQLSHCGKIVYCNKSCESSDRKRRVELKCNTCGKIYEKLASKNKSKYCSRKCMGLGHKNTFIKRKPRYRSYGECAIVCLLKKNYPHLTIKSSDREQLNGYEIDIWIPELNTGIEYNGPHHFKPVYGNDVFVKTQKADLEKSQIAKNKNIKLIYVIQHISISKTQKTKLYQLFVDCCNQLGLPTPNILDIKSEEIYNEQKNCVPSNKKYINLGRKHSDKTKLKFSTVRSKTYVLKSPTGELVTVNRLREFCEKENIQYTWLLTQFKKGNPCKGWTKIR